MAASKQKTHIRNKMRNLQAWVDIAHHSKNADQFMDNLDTVIQVLKEAAVMMQDHEKDKERF